MVNLKVQLEQSKDPPPQFHSCIEKKLIGLMIWQRSTLRKISQRHHCCLQLEQKKAPKNRDFVKEEL